MEKLIDEKSVETLTKRFAEELKKEVTVDIFVNTQDKSEFCTFCENLLTELNAIDSKIKYNVLDAESEEAKELGVIGTPTLMIGAAEGYKIGFRGAPLGYEASSLIEAIVLVSSDESRLSPQSKEALKDAKNSKIDVYVTPTCPYCPRSVVLAFQLAIEAKGKIEAYCVEAQENMELAAKFNVSSVPQQVINDSTDSITIGVQPEAKFVAQVVELSK